MATKGFGQATYRLGSPDTPPLCGVARNGHGGAAAKPQSFGGKQASTRRIRANPLASGCHPLSKQAGLGHFPYQ